MSNKKTTFSLLINIGSNVFSQILIVVFIPILARLYKPEDFALATLFLGAASCFVSISSLRLSVTIPLSQTKKEKGLALIISSMIVVLLTIFFFVLNHLWPFLGFLGLDDLSYILFFFVIISSLNNIFTNIVISNGNYNFIGGSKILTSITLNLSRLLIAYTAISNGLVYSLLISETVALIFLFYGSKKIIKNYMSEHKFILKDYIDFIRKYKNYPKFQVLSQFILISSQYAPVFMLSNNFSAMQVGLFVMANNLVSLPVNSIGSALSQIYLGEYRKEEKRKNIFKHSFYIVAFFIISSVPFVFIISKWGDFIVGFILGEQWIKSAPLISMLIFLGAAKLCMAVISQSLNIFNSQRLQLTINILIFVLSYSSLYLSIKLNVDFYSTVLFYTISGSVALFVGIYLTMRNIMVKSKHENSIFR